MVNFRNQFDKALTKKSSERRALDDTKLQLCTEILVHSNSVVTNSSGLTGVVPYSST
jgi:hypothetical protein